MKSQSQKNSEEIIKIQGELKVIHEKITNIIVDKLSVEESRVVPEASFLDDLGADSLDTVELIMEFEEEFDLEIPDEDAEKITTVGAALEYINNNSK